MMNHLVMHIVFISVRNTDFNKLIFLNLYYRYEIYTLRNNIDCEYNYRDIVIEYIKKFEKNYEFLIISGDNWYTNKYDDDDLRSYKMYFTNVLCSGLIKLYALNKDCHIILGNHDEDVDDDYSKLKEDCMLNTEEYNIRLINNNLLLPATISLEELQNQKYIRYLMQESVKYTKSSHLSDHKLILHKCKEEIDYIYANDILIIFTNTIELQNIYLLWGTNP